MKPTPKDWPRLSSALFYEDAAKAIDWLCNAFGFVVRLKVDRDGGRIVHSELTYGEALIMVAQSGPNPNHPEFPPAVSPLTIKGGNTQSLMLFVDDVTAHCEHARANGAKIVDEPKLHDYGPDYWTDRSYGALDLDGHLWWFSERVRDPQK
jgi:uncharacterized glyoxalase superfamily protein PhnB